jgi:hypothetical protein
MSSGRRDYKLGVEFVVRSHRGLDCCIDTTDAVVRGEGRERPLYTAATEHKSATVLDLRALTLI